MKMRIRYAFAAATVAFAPASNAGGVIISPLCHDGVVSTAHPKVRRTVTRAFGLRATSAFPALEGLSYSTNLFLRLSPLRPAVRQRHASPSSA